MTVRVRTARRISGPISRQMQRTSLYNTQTTLNARFAGYGEWELAADFGDARAECDAVRESMGVLDRCARARLVISGADRYTWLQGMVSNDVRKLENGDRTLQACLLNATGHMLADLTIINRQDSLLLDLDWATRQRTFDLLNQYIITEDVEIVDQSEYLACISVQGSLVVNAVGKCEQEYGEYAYDSDHTGSGGYDFYVRTDEAINLYKRLISCGAKPVGETAANILRVEAGIPSYSVDMDETTIPLEAGLESTHISYSKGCYVGQEIIARIQSRGHTNRALVGFYVVGEGLPQPGERIVDELGGAGKDVGWITSVVESKRTGGPIALGYLRHELRGIKTLTFSEGGTILLQTEVPFVPNSTPT